MDSQYPTQPPTPHWPAPSLGQPAPGNIPAPAAHHDPGDTQPVGPSAAPPAPPAPQGTVPMAPAPGSDDYAQETRAIYRDGQRMLYYALNFARFLMPERVYGQKRIYEAVEVLALIRLHSGLGRLVRAQMPLARGGDADGDLPWRDLILHLQTRGAILPADAAFLNEVTRVRNRLAAGERVRVDREMLLHLIQLGDGIFAKLDPDYHPPDLDPVQDALPTPVRPAPDPAPTGSMPTPSATPAGPVPATGPQPVGHSDRPAHPMAAGAQRSPMPGGILYCPSCGRGVLPDDLWCPRCQANFTNPNAPPPSPTPPSLSSGVTTTRRRRLFGRLLGER